jgi:hypothetical protein
MTSIGDSATDGKYSRVHVRVRAEGCGHGRVVGISGNCNALGYFDPRRALQMVTTPEAYPIWTTLSPLVVPAGEPLEYKFCLFEDGTFKSFETISTVRSVIPAEPDTVVENIFNVSLVDRISSLDDIKLYEKIGDTPKKPSVGGSENDFGVQGCLYLACYHLPVSIVRTGTVPSFQISWGDSIIAKTDGAVSDRVRTHWVGTVSVPGPPITDSERSELVGQLRLMNCLPIFLDKSLTDASYLGYCKQVLWPVFHNIDQLDCQTSLLGTSADETDSFRWNYAKSHTHWWDAYQSVNKAFCDAISPQLHPHDVVWIHDYHLMLVPGMLREVVQPSLRIIFYLHIPFPTSQVF